MNPHLKKRVFTGQTRESQLIANHRPTFKKIQPIPIEIINQPFTFEENSNQLEESHHSDCNSYLKFIFLKEESDSYGEDDEEDDDNDNSDQDM